MCFTLVKSLQMFFKLKYMYLLFKCINLVDPFQLKIVSSQFFPLDFSVGVLSLDYEITAVSTFE